MRKKLLKSISIIKCFSWNPFSFRIWAFFKENQSFITKKLRFLLNYLSKTVYFLSRNGYSLLINISMTISGRYNFSRTDLKTHKFERLHVLSQIFLPSQATNAKSERIFSKNGKALIFSKHMFCINFFSHFCRWPAVKSSNFLGRTGF